jgi:hypothetical protein
MKKILFLTLFIFFILVNDVFSQNDSERIYPVNPFLELINQIFPEAYFEYIEITLEGSFYGVRPVKIVLHIPDRFFRNQLTDEEINERVWELVDSLWGSVNYGIYEYSEPYEFSHWLYQYEDPVIRELTISMGMASACPVVFIFDGESYIENTEIIENCVGKSQERTNFTFIQDSIIIDNQIKIKIKELKEETSYINSIILIAGENEIIPDNCPSELLEDDDNYIILSKDEEIELTFSLDAVYREVFLKTRGYYIPE